MTLPNFLGIGAMRSGTSWLYVQLRSHRQVYMSEQKELNFFNDFYHYGIDWYSGHFPTAKEAVKYKAIGEITPTYMADPDAPSRMHVHVPDCRFIVMLRNPIDRAYSEYTKALRNLNYKGTFDQFVDGCEDVLRRGCYTEQLERYFRLFSRNQFLILIFEEAVSNHRATIQRLAAFLDIDPNGFDLNRMKQRVNPSYLPRMPGLFSSIVKVRQYLVKRDLGKVVTTAEKIGLFHAGRYLFRSRGQRSELPKMDEKIQKRLNDVYLQEIHNLEELLGSNLTTWRNSPRLSTPPASPWPASL
jgi:Sulfotransferase domain